MLIAMRERRRSPRAGATVLRGLGVAGLFCLGLAAMHLAFGPHQGAWAQSQPSGRDIQALVDRIDRLQRQLTTLERQVYRGDQPRGQAQGPSRSSGAGALGEGEPNLAAAMQVRLAEIETQMREFTGQMEELRHAVDTLHKRVESLASDVDYRLRALESGGAPPAQGTPGAPAQLGDAPGAERPVVPGTASDQPGILGTISRSDLERSRSSPDGAPPPQGADAPVPQRGAGTAPPEGQVGALPSPREERPRAPGEGAVPLPEGTPEEQYKFATGLLFQSDFEGAERAFSAFLAANPEHQLAGNAKYWLGETHYVRGDFRTAAAIFAEGYQKYPKSSKSADNLLKLGLSLAAIDKKDSACATFGRLLKEFSGAPSSVRSRAQAKREDLGCR